MKRIVVAISVLVLASCSPSERPPRHMLNCQLPSRFQYITMALPRVKLEVNRIGGVKWNDTPVDRKTMALYFSDVGQQDPQPILVIVTSDLDTHYMTVASVLTLMHDQKAYKIAFETSHRRSLPPFAIDVPVLTGCWTGPTGKTDPKDIEEISLAADGNARWNGEFVLRGEVARLLDRSGRTTPQPLIVVKIDPQTKYYDFADLMYELQWNGIERIRFETD